MKALNKKFETASQKKSRLGIMLMITAMVFTIGASGMRLAEGSAQITKQNMLLQTKEKELQGTDAGTQEGQVSPKDLPPSSTALRQFAGQASQIAARRNVQLERVTSTGIPAPTTPNPEGGAAMKPQDVEIILSGNSLDLFRTIDDLRLSGLAFQYTSIDLGRSQQGQTQTGQSRATVKAQVFAKTE